MKLSPRIIQAMEILQLPLLALQERIDAELESNPVLEMRDVGVDEEAPVQRDDDDPDRGERALVVEDKNDNSEDFQRLAEMEAEYGPSVISDDMPYRRPRAPDGERDRKLDAMSNTPAPAESLNEYLLHQWAFVEMPDEIRSAGALIITHMDADGYCRVPLEELPERTNEPVTLEALTAALVLVQGLDPVGIGARNLQECLALQLAVETEAGRDASLEMEIVLRHLRDIEMNRLPLIARRTGRTMEEVKSAIESISHLNPRPGLLVGQRSAPVICPDALVSIDDSGEVIVTTSDEYVPQLHISRQYRRMARDRKTERDARQFLQKNVRTGQWLISAIRQRRETVRRVTVEVFKVQREFLEVGTEALRPLPMAEIAGKVGVHVATVSRAVAGKYVQTPRGIYPLRMFFSGGTTTTDGEDVAWDAVKVKLKEVIDHEDKTRPLKDDQLVEELKKHGIDIARRTVAKYRNLLKIPQSRKRKQY